MKNNEFLYILILICDCFLAGFCQFLLKKASQKNIESFLGQYLNPLVVVAYMLFFVTICVSSFLLKYLYILTVSAFSETMPIMISSLFGYFCFNEKISLRTVTGMFFLLAGVLFVVLGGNGNG